jgi:hypothetical protein
MERVEVQGSRFERSAQGRDRDGEQGFMLLGLMVAIAIILLFLGVAASDAAFSLRREKELESARRADQYVRAIHLYWKNGHYPGSIEQLENTNHVRYLRQQYVDPLTGKADYRMIVVGQNKTTVKGFFGQPLGGIGAPGPGAIGGGPQGLGSGTGTSVGGVNGTTGGTGGSGLDKTGGNGSGASGGGPAGSGTDGSSPTTSPIGSPQGGSGLGAATGPIMGVGSSASGPSILTVNGQTSYETWEFLYDPRLEQLKVAAALNSGLASGQAGDPTPPPVSHP